MKHPDLVTQTLFCEFAKSDAGNVVSLIGIFPDNVNLAFQEHESIAGPERPVPILPNLAIYSRTRLPLDRELKGPMSISFLSPSGELIAGHTFEQDFLKSSFDKAVDQGQEYVTFIAQISIQGFGVTEPGGFTAIVEYGGETYFSGRLNIAFGEQVAA